MRKMLVVLLLGCISCFHLAPVVRADGRVFVLELRNSSGLLGHKDAEQACAAQHTRLASAEELRQAVVDCFFSTCTRGWLFDGTVGTTVCNTEGSTPKAVDVKAENVTEDFSDLSAFCIKDKGKPCGDPPSFPNAHLQGHTGFELGDELMYSCLPGYVIPSGNSAFSLLCDSCGEWYGLVQLCVKDDAESLIDFEDQFTNSYKQPKAPEEAQSQVYQEVQDAVFRQHSETSFNSDEATRQDEQAVLDDPGESVDLSKKMDEAALGEEQAEEGGMRDFIVNQSWGQERTEVVKTEDLPTTHSPVSLLSQKHLFWFPSEAFQEGHPISVSSNSATQTSTGVQSNESKEQESKEVDLQHTVDFTDQVGPFDNHNDSRSHEHDTLDSHQDEKDDHVTIYIPTRDNVDLSREDRLDDEDNHDDHYDMGEQEEDRIHVHHDSREYDGTEQDEHESFEDHTENPGLSQELVDHNDHEDTDEPYDPDDNDSYEDNSRQHVFFTTDSERQNVSQKATGTKATTDDTWLDGYPIAQKEAGQDASTAQNDQVTPNPNEIDAFLNTGFPNTEPGLDQLGKEDATAAARPDPSDSHSYSDTIDYDTQQAAPTNSWHADLTEHPYLDQGPIPPLNDLDVLAGDRDVEEHLTDNLPGETGERGDVEGEKGIVERGEGERGEAVCTDETCPPPSSSRRGPTVAAIIIAVCVVAAAVIMGVWCYRRQLQKSSVYEMNGKGQGQKRQGQHMEMQQKV